MGTWRLARRFIALIGVVSLLCSNLSATPVRAARPPPFGPEARPAFQEPPPDEPPPLVPIDSDPVPLPDPPPPGLPAQATIESAPVPSFGHLPLTFIPNFGQVADNQVRFVGRGRSAQFHFGLDEVRLTLPLVVPNPDRDHPRRDQRPADQAVGLGALRVRLEGANQRPLVEGIALLPGKANYYFGNNPNEWYTDLPTYGGVRYNDVYPGIDLLYEGSSGALKSTYVVAPGVDPGQIRWRYVGSNRPELDAAGNLQFTVPVTMPVPPVTSTVTLTDESSGALLEGTGAAMQPTALVTVTEQAPIAWQEINGQKISVAVQFVIAQNHRVSFAVGSYDPLYQLIIDPTLVSSSFLGGGGTDQGHDIALDSAGNIYLTGRTLSPTFPGSGTRTHYQAFVVKLNPSASQILYTTFIDGNGDDSSAGVAVDGSGQAYISGYTRSTNLPVVSAYQATLRGTQDAFVAKLNGTGQPVYLTYLGGVTPGSPSSWEFATGIAVNSAGEAHITGSTDADNFPLQNAILSQRSQIDIFITKLSSNGTGLIYSSYIGGGGFDYPGGITLDSVDNAYITGRVTGNRNNYLTKTLTGTNFDGAFVLKVNSSGGRDFGVVFGLAHGEGIAVDATGATYVVGNIESANARPIPLPPGSYQSTLQGESDLFLVKVAPDGQTLQTGSFLGSPDDDWCYDIALDSTNTAYVIGNTYSTNFPTAVPLYAVNQGNHDAFVAAFTGGGTGLSYSTYLGGSNDEFGNGIAANAAGDVYLTGITQSSSFPVVSPIQSFGSLQGGQDAFVSVLARATILPDDQQNTPEDWCSCPPPQRQTAEPVNTRTGNFWFDVRDLAVQTQGPALAWRRTYASQTLSTWTMGLPPGWRHPYATRFYAPSVSGEPGRAVVVSPDGNRLRFEDLGNGQFRPFAGVYAGLAQGTGVFTYTLRDQTRYLYDDGPGFLRAVIDSQGRRVNLTYDGSNRLTTITDGQDTSRRLTLTYGTNGLIQSVSDGVRQISYGYDAANNLASVTDVMGRLTTYSYHAGTRLIYEIRNPLNQLVEQVLYDTATPPRVTQQTLQDSSQRIFQYLAASTVMTTTGVDGRVDREEVFYGANNAMTGVTRGNQAVLASSFDDTISPGVLRDGNNNQTTTRFNDNGQPLSSTNALGQQTRRVYDPRNNLVEMTDALGITTRYRYDQYNNVISMTLGITTSSLLRLTTLYTYTYNVRYPGDSLLQEMRSPDGVVTRSEYPTTGTLAQRGQKIRLIVGYGTSLAQTTGYAYDALGRVVTTTLGLGTPFQRLNITEYHADNSLKRTIQNYKDGVYTATRSDEDLITTYGYDPAGRQIWVRNPLGQYDATHYNGRGQVDWTARNVVPLQTDPQGQVVFQAFAVANPDRNVATLYAYDGLGRTTLVTETGILTGSFTLATRQFASATTRTTLTEYDTLSRPITVTLNYQSGLASSADRNVKLYTRYDGAGNVITQTDALGRRTSTQYDALNRPITVTLNYEDGNPLIGSPEADIQTVTRYDALGRVIRVIENYVNNVVEATDTITDRATLYQYDTLSRVITTTLNQAPGRTDLPFNRSTLLRYDPGTGHLIAQRDTLGRWVAMQYDLLGRLTHTTQNCTNSSGTPIPSGCVPFSASQRSRNSTAFTAYDSLGRPVDSYQNYVDGIYSSTQPDQDVPTRSVYDGLGRVISSMAGFENGTYDPATPDRDVITQRAYDALGRTLVITDVRGATTRSAYTGLGQTRVITDSVGRVTRFGYDGTGALRWQETPDGRVTLFRVDGLGRVVSTIQSYQDGVSSGAEPDTDLITLTQYDAAGRRISVTDPLGRVTRFAYDTLDRLKTVTENYLVSGCAATDCNLQTQYQYDRAGNRTRVTNAGGVVTERAVYDAASQLLSVTDALTRTTSYAYNAGGYLTRQVDPRGTNTALSYSYDGLNRLTATTNVTSSLAITTAYDGLGRRLSLTDGSGTTSFTYDALGRMRSVVAPTVGTTSYTYTGRGERASLTYPGGSLTVSYGYFPDGQLQTVTQAGTTLATYAYDPAGRLSQLAQANGVVTNYRYDRADRLRAVRSLSGGVLAGSFAYQTDRLGNRTVISDTLPTTVTPLASRLKTLTFEAARLSDPTSGADAVVGSLSLEQTSPLREGSAARVSGQSSSYLREDVGPLDGLYVTFSLRVDAAPSATTAILTIRNGSTTVGNLALTSGRLLQLRNGTTVLGSSTALTVGTVYRVGLRQQKGTGANGVLQAVLAVGETGFGSPFAQSSSQRFTTQASQVWLGATGSVATSITMDDVALDTAGFAGPSGVAPTRVTSYGYDRMNRLTSAGESPGSSFSSTYDRRGNRTILGRVFNGADQVGTWPYDPAGNLLNDGTATYTYDALNRLTSRTTGGVTTSYRYNGDPSAGSGHSGVLMAATTGGTTTHYAQDLAAPLSQVLQTLVGSTRTSYLYGRERLAIAGSPRTWYLADGLGSTRRTLNDSGAALSSTSYDPWGTPQSALSTPFGFTGELQPGGAGVYLRARWYAPANATFLSRDPFPGFPERPFSLNPYQYAYASPVLLRDATGMTPELQGVADGKYFYTCNCGWLDKGHLSPNMASDVLKAVRRAADYFKRNPDPSDCDNDFYYIDPRDITMSVSLGLPGDWDTRGTTHNAVAIPRRALQSVTDEQEVAMGIYRWVSENQERAGTSFDIPFTSNREDTRFAEEDLPSNLIAFYAALALGEGYGAQSSSGWFSTLTEWLRPKCGFPQSDIDRVMWSTVIFLSYGEFGRTTEWEKPTLKGTQDVLNMCKHCGVTQRHWPSEFTRVKSSPRGQLILSRSTGKPYYTPDPNVDWYVVLPIN